MRITMIIATLCIGVLLILSACTRPAPSPPALPTSAPTPEPAPVQRTSEVLLSGREFKPSVITVSVGTKVTWTNQEGDQHTVSSATGLFLFDASLAFGQSFSYTFTERGTFEYNCNIHGQMGMNGAVVVK